METGEGNDNAVFRRGYPIVLQFINSQVGPRPTPTCLERVRSAILECQQEIVEVKKRKEKEKDAPGAPTRPSKKKNKTGNGTD